MANTTYNKIVYGGKTLIDLTSDTVDAEHLLSGYTAHDKSGAIITGTNTFDSDTSDDTATAAEILSGKTAHARGTLLTGTMPNRGAASGTISTLDGSYSIQQGYHDGSGTVTIDSTEAAKLVPANIREGITVLGVTGTMSGTEEVNAEAPTVTPRTTAQTVTPSTGYNYLSQVTVEAIPYAESDNAAGGITVVIG